MAFDSMLSIELTRASDSLISISRRASVSGNSMSPASTTKTTEITDEYIFVGKFELPTDFTDGFSNFNYRRKIHQ